MEGTSKLSPQHLISKRKFLIGALTTLGAILGGKKAFQTHPSESLHPAVEQPPGVAASNLSPYKDLLAPFAAQGKFMTQPTKENGVSVSKVTENPELIRISRFTYPSEYARRKMTIRRYPFHNTQKGEEGAFEIDPKQLNPQDFVLIRVSGSDYGYESTNLKDKDGKILGIVSPWYMFVKELPGKPRSCVTKPFVTVNPLTKQPIQQNEPPFVISRYMFEPNLPIQTPIPASTPSLAPQK